MQCVRKICAQSGVVEVMDFKNMARNRLIVCTKTRNTGLRRRVVSHCVRYVYKHHLMNSYHVRIVSAINVFVIMYILCISSTD